MTKMEIDARLKDLAKIDHNAAVLLRLRRGDPTALLVNRQAIEQYLTREDRIMDTSKAAADLGRAGRGECKRRGGSDYYRALVAKRKDRSS